MGHYENVTTEGFFWNKKPKVEKVSQPRTADYQQFADHLANIYNNFDEQGYDVVNVIPLAIGATESVHASRGGQPNYLGETGFSVTRGAIVVGKRRD
ncbi:hypothetical protein CE206_29405 (plasmid) [Achromobacter xylosoxidans]|uniref:hypothetical protein n=1 Tax=Alcaligenes xylosoxydans xylosoxydans TaxID=85698 RepID=UPI000DD1309F|nr:hypothetical protein [Achromobacter xylosoxidans]AXA80686.1 hypothetical protein CE206_29405 [Achromobacter xylosoxidans]